ncbi:BQ2448_6521 [Microbotryum intermedium]|uniref:BQ2448_6521 protein n=1 Tax=Microbotryum intermedium TaxID=269621 RepID=A0A238FMR3_9BASI|nr:BQ2448_6521 [Microbotryum intermedium]
MRSSIALCLTALLFSTALVFAAPVPLPRAGSADPVYADSKQTNDGTEVVTAKSTGVKADSSRLLKGWKLASKVAPKEMNRDSWTGGTTYSGMKKLRRRRFSSSSSFPSNCQFRTGDLRF